MVLRQVGVLTAIGGVFGMLGAFAAWGLAHYGGLGYWPALVLAPNKTLAAQLYSEFREFFPENAVEYFVSYYDYYQPEAYVPQTDTYIEKDSSINEEVERLRHSATNSLLTRRDTIVVSTVSCIYGLGTPQEYVDRMVRLRKQVLDPSRHVAAFDLEPGDEVITTPLTFVCTATCASARSTSRTTGLSRPRPRPRSATCWT